MSSYDIESDLQQMDDHDREVLEKCNDLANIDAELIDDSEVGKVEEFAS